MTTAVAIKERPILFSGEMVKAILDGTKTQTRRVMRYQPVERSDGIWDYIEPGGWRGAINPSSGQWNFADKCPYGRRKNRLWVRETFTIETNCDASIPDYNPPFTDGRPVKWADDGEGDYWEQCHYRATDPTPELEIGKEDPGVLWRPSIFMPRWASRILLEITDVRVERVQDISEADAVAEGVTAWRSEWWQGFMRDKDGGRHMVEGGGDPNLPPPDWMEHPEKQVSITTAVERYRDLWDSINARRGYGWAVNPWVWVVTFQRVERSEV